MLSPQTISIHGLFITSMTSVSRDSYQRRSPVCRGHAVRITVIQENQFNAKTNKQEKTTIQDFLFILGERI